MTFEEIEDALAKSLKHDWQTVTANTAGSRAVAFWKDDVLLRAEVDWATTENDDFKEAWANKYPNKRAASYEAVVYYGPTLIETHILVLVDGGRAALPLPDPTTLRTTNRRYLIASLFDSVGTLDTYMASSGLTVA